MECSFWQVLPSIVTTIAAIITAGATYEIMRFTQIQSDVSSQKRKDDLFKIRYEFYLEICKFIRNEICMYEDKQDPSYQLTAYDCMSDKELEPMHDLHLQENLLFKAECLFDNDIVDYLKIHLSYKASKKGKFFKLLNKNQNFDPNESFTKYFSKEFNAKFEKYLKLK